MSTHAYASSRGSHELFSPEVFVRRHAFRHRSRTAPHENACPAAWFQPPSTGPRLCSPSRSRDQIWICLLLACNHHCPTPGQTSRVVAIKTYRQGAIRESAARSASLCGDKASAALSDDAREIRSSVCLISCCCHEKPCSMLHPPN